MPEDDEDRDSTGKEKEDISEKEVMDDSKNMLLPSTRKITP